jgi:transcriptional regulator
VYGQLRIIEGPELLESLRTLTDKHELNSAHPVSVDRMAPKFVESEMRMIVGIDITIDRFEASYKLSQNRDQKNHDSIVSELKKKGDEISTAVAREMVKSRHKGDRRHEKD